MKITFMVDRQCIRRTDDMTVVGDSVHYLRAQFILLDDWDDTHILTPIFERGTRVYTPQIMKNGKYLDHDNTCIVPHEALRGEGVLYVSIFDETAGVRITTNREAVQICPSGYTAQAEQSLTPAPTVYDEILRAYGDISNKIATPDWSQSDSTQPDYIKNRPFYKEQTAVDYVKLYASNMDIDLGLGFYGEKIGLVIGQTYAVDIVSDTGETTTVDCECVDCAEDVELPNNTIPLLRYNSFEIFDGVSMDADGNPVIAETAIYIVADHIVSVTIHGVSSVDEVIHKIPNEFLDVDNTFDANSQKPQSGKAVNNAMHSALNQFMVGTTQIEDSSVTADKLAIGSVTTDKLLNSSITDVKLANSSIVSRTIKDNAVTKSKIATNSIDGGLHIIKNSIGGDALKNNSIIGEKIAEGSITRRKLVLPKLISSFELGSLDDDVGLFGCSNNQFKKLVVSGTVVVNASDNDVPFGIDIGLYDYDYINKKHTKVRTMMIDDFTPNSVFHIFVTLECFPQRYMLTTVNINTSPPTQTSYSHMFTTAADFSNKSVSLYFANNAVNGFYMCFTKDKLYKPGTDLKVWGIEDGLGTIISEEVS